MNFELNNNNNNNNNNNDDDNKSTNHTNEKSIKINNIFRVLRNRFLEIVNKIGKCLKKILEDILLFSIFLYNGFHLYMIWG